MTEGVSIWYVHTRLTSTHTLSLSDIAISGRMDGCVCTSGRPSVGLDVWNTKRTKIDRLTDSLDGWINGPGSARLTQRITSHHTIEGEADVRNYKYIGRYTQTYRQAGRQAGREARQTDRQTDGQTVRSPPDRSARVRVSVGRCVCMVYLTDSNPQAVTDVFFAVCVSGCVCADGWTDRWTAKPASESNGRVSARKMAHIQRQTGRQTG